MPDEIAISLAGMPMDIALHYREAGIYFRHWLRQDAACGIRVSASDDDIEAELKRYPAGSHPGNAELTALVYRLSDRLLPLGKVFFHGLAIRFKGKAWIFTGPSGVGKTTQYRLLRKLHGEDIELICGDRPILEATADGAIVVHPTPWNGKENMKSCMENATLGGIICLKQELSNSICVLPRRESVLYLFRQLLFLPNCRENVTMAGEILSAVVKYAPVWFLANKGDEASAELAFQTLKESADAIQNQS